jgi:enoyl-CoA hydratase/3-hydroxyacyl-CoA dehydrogenase
MMRELGEKEIQRLVIMVTGKYQMEMPRSIGIKYWKPVTVKLQKNKSVAVIRMDQPENLNALSEETVKQLGECFSNAENDNDVKTIFITGSGKAFVAGADIRFFVNNMKKERICDIETFTEFGQKVFDQIDRSQKKVVAIINGLALGGGLELALCADVILAVPKAAMAFPETGIGIYPGLGGTQRTVKRVGKGFSKYLVLTGKMLTAAEAEETGLIDKVISPEEMFEMLSGEMTVPQQHQRKPGGKWKAIHNFFENNSLGNILAEHVFMNDLSAEESARIIKTLRFKAPVALKLADRLIDDALGCASELSHLREIFSTSDAMKGLTSIGQKVTYEGK